MCMPAPIHVVIESIGYRIRLDLQSEMPVLRWQQMSFRYDAGCVTPILAFRALRNHHRNHHPDHHPDHRRNHRHNQHLNQHLNQRRNQRRNH